MKTKTKTFEIQSDMGDLVDWFIKNIDTEDREIIESGASPSMDVVCETIKKYTITIKAHE